MTEKNRFPNLRNIIVAYLFLLGVTYIVLRTLAMPTVTCWFVISTGGAGYFLFYTHQHLYLNRLIDNNTQLSKLGWANTLSLLRGLLIAMTLGFICPNIPRIFLWFPAIFYTLAAIADFFDGYIARATDEVTHLGAVLDLHFDGIGVLVAVSVAVAGGQLPWWYLSVGLARYLFLLGIRLIEASGGKTHPLPPSNMRRILSGVQMGFLAGALYPLFAPSLTTLLGIFIFIPFMIGFLRDFLAVAGWLPQKPTMNS